MSKPRKNRPDSPPATEPVTDSPEFDLSIPAAPQGRAMAPPPAPGDGELELEDAGERSSARLKIPEHRREQPMFEVAGQVAPKPADARDKGPAPEFEGRVEQIWQAASEEDIVGYDPAHEPVAAPAPAAAPKSRKVEQEFDELPAAPFARGEKAQDLSELDEFLAKTADSSPEAAVKRARRPFSKAEWIFLGSGGAVLLGLAIWLFGAMTSGTGTDVHRSDPLPDLPLEGDLVTVEEISSGWRARKDTDRVARMEVVLPKPGEIMPALIPHVDFTISSSSKSGYLRFIFKDGQGAPRGDTRVVRVEAGKLTSLDNGEVINSATAGSVYSSNGLQDTSTFNTYTSSEDPRWSVEVSESAAYDTKDKDWKFLAQFDIRNAMLK